MDTIEQFDIISLDDNKEYVVASLLKKDENEYLYLIEVDENEDPIKENQRIVKRVIKDGEESVEEVSEQEKIELAKLFFDIFSAELKDMNNDSNEE